MYRQDEEKIQQYSTLTTLDHLYSKEVQYVLEVDPEGLMLWAIVLSGNYLYTKKDP